MTHGTTRGRSIPIRCVAAPPGTWPAPLGFLGSTAAPGRPSQKGRVAFLGFAKYDEIPFHNIINPRNPKF